MNKFLSRLGLFAVILFGLTLYSSSAEAQIFGSEEENWNKVFVELKKINSRLVVMETEGAGRVQNSLENLLREVEEIKHVIPQLQGVVELNKSETLSGLNKTNAKLGDLEAAMKNQILDKIQQQNKNLENFVQDNGSIRAVLNKDLIPTLKNESNKTRQELLSEFEKLKFSQNRLEEKLESVIKNLADLRRKADDQPVGGWV